MVALTRRQVFAAGASGLTLALLDQARANARTRTQPFTATLPAADDFGITSTDSSMLSYFSSDFMTCYQTEYSRTVGLSSQTSVPKGATATLTYDARCFDVGSAILVAGSDITRLKPEIGPLLNNAGSATFAFEREIGFDDSEVTLLLPLSPRSLFPNENISAMGPMSLAVNSAEGIQLATLSLLTATVAREASPWGARVVGAWADVPVLEETNRLKYRYPTFIRVSSTGPSAVPAKSTLTIDFDAQIIASCTISAVTVNGQPVPTASYSTTSWSGGGLLRMTVTLADEIPADAALDVALVANPTSGPAQRVEGVTLARARFSGNETSARPMRETAQMLLVDVSKSGTGSTTAVSTGTV